MSDVDAMVAWLRSVWDADEQAAREAGGGQWADGFRAGVEAAKDRAAALVADDIPDGPANAHLIEDLEVPIPDHVARHDPRDTLARIDGERRVLEDYRITDAAIRREVDSGIGLDDPWLEKMRAVRDALRAALRALAYGYRHRAGWQDGWAPRR